MAECRCTEKNDVDAMRKRIVKAKTNFINGSTGEWFDTLNADIKILHDGCSGAFNSVNEVSLKGYINGLDNKLEVVKNSVLAKINERILELNTKYNELNEEDTEYHEALKKQEETGTGAGA